MSSRASRAPRAKHTRAPLFVALSVVFAILALAGVGVASTIKLCDSWTEDLPDVSDIASYSTSGITRIYAADHTTLLAELYLENRQPVAYDQVSPYVYDATVATEDERFYQHDGVDLQGIARAVVVNLTSNGTSEGASTITQQLVRNTILSDEMNDISLKRKVREADLALQVEKVYSKDDILNMYCNTVNYGDGCYGIQAAARNYFSKDAKDLTLAEAALLAGIPQSPTRLNPFNDLEAATSRRNVVLSRMLSNGYISQSDYDTAVAEPVTLNKTADGSYNGIYQQPYFVDYVKQELSKDYSTAEIFKGGLTVYTTLDMNCQAAAESACSSALDGQADDLEMGLISIEPGTGHIVAMYGGKDYFTDQWNVATQASRQCGSSYKAITLATAIEAGMDPQTKFNGSSPMKVTSDWTVANDSNESVSSVTLEKATWMSLNTVYAQVAVQLGADKIVDMSKRLGITSELEAVPSITLGTQGVTCLEMADSFATFAAGGQHHDPTSITEILDAEGQTIYKEDATTTQAITPEVAYATTKVLEGDISSGTATSARLANADQVCAGKTGTTETYNNAYFVGYTPQLSTAVWVGTRDNRDDVTMNGGLIYGSTACCPTWKKYMDVALQSYGTKGWTTANTPNYTLKNTSTSTPVEEKRVEEYSSTVAAGQEIRRETTDGVTTIYISKGPDPATQATTVTEYEYSSTVAAGQEIRRYTSGTVTHIVISNGPDPSTTTPVTPTDPTTPTTPTNPTP